MSTTHEKNGASATHAVANSLAGVPAFLDELRRLAAERRAEEIQIESQYQAAKKAMERGYDDSRLSLLAQLELERGDLASDLEEQRRHAFSRFQIESTAVEAEFARVRQEAAQEHEAKSQRAERKLKEARWECETLFEAGRDLAPNQLKEFEAQLDAWLELVRGEKAAAQVLLDEWRQPLEDPPTPDNEWPEPPARDFVVRLQERVQWVGDARARLAALRVPPLVASGAIVWAAVLVGLLLIGLALVGGLGWQGALAALVFSASVGTGVTIYLHKLARADVARVYPTLCHAAREAETLAQSALDEARARTAAQQAELHKRHEQALLAADAKYYSRVAKANRRRDARLAEAEGTYPGRLNAIAERRQRDLELAESNRLRRMAEIRRLEASLPAIEQQFQRQSQQLEQRVAGQWQRLAEQWSASMTRAQALAERIRGAAPGESLRLGQAEWHKLAGGAYLPARELPPAVRFGQLRVSTSQIPQGVSQTAALAELTPNEFVVPALVPFPQQPSLLLKAQGAARGAAIELLQATMLRFLVALPPGKLRFTIVDPIGLGENFAAFMHLADYNEALVNGRIWTEPKQIEERLADLSEHMENVIQKYLRNEFESIEQYNRDAGEVSEPYRILVVADFPANFSEAAQRRLLSIAASGARCGVYTLIMADAKRPLASGLSLAELEAHSATLTWRDGRFAWKHETFGPFELLLDAPPPAKQVTELLHTAARLAADAGHVEVPFDVIAPAEDALWSSSARSGIDVPLGRVGATRLQALRLGHGTSQHVLVAGKTGSGKSTLLHALITNLALRYDPDEIELYLVDFKQGVEFKTYATHRLPHARVVAIESDREFGVSVLARLDGELRARAERFRTLGVQDLAGFRQAQPGSPLPRIVLIVDEFQEFFVEDDRISQDAALLLDRLVRQGRAFGIHVLLGSQTLAGTYSLARSTIGQMAVRIALQCSEADAHLILSEDNSAARSLSRAGEAIYNDSNGLIEGNHPFQVVWLGDDRREQYLEQVLALAEQRAVAPRTQVVFEGNQPANPERNVALAALIAGPRPLVAPSEPWAWLGDAVAIKDPTSVTFRRQSGSNLLLVGQYEEAAVGILATALVGLSAQHPLSAAARFYVFDGSPANSESAASLELLTHLTSDPVRLITWRQLPAAVQELVAEVERRQREPGNVPPIFVFVHGLQKLRDLRRQEDDFGFSRSGEDRPADPAKQFSMVLRDGPSVGVHAIVWCDSVNNLNRAWDRQTLREFEMRVAFQMSANDSSTFIDTPLGGKLGMHRALFHSEELGVLEKFRPYRWPGEDWLEQVRQRLHAGDEERDNRAQPLSV